jgi:hypothetical protein
METAVMLTPYENFLDGLKVPETRRQYPSRLHKFMTFMGLQGEVTPKQVVDKYLSNPGTCFEQKN